MAGRREFDVTVVGASGECNDARHCCRLGALIVACCLQALLAAAS